MFGISIPIWRCIPAAPAPRAIAVPCAGGPAGGGLVPEAHPAIREQRRARRGIPAGMGAALLALSALFVLGHVEAGAPGRAAPVPPPGSAEAALVDDAPVRRVVGFFPLWARNAGYSERDVDFSVVTHLAHFAVLPRPDGTIAIPDWGPFPDPALLARARAYGVPVSLVVGGDERAAAEAFAAVASDAGARAAFVANLTEIVERYGYDGVDIDWEYPSSTRDRDGLTALVADLRAALGPGRLLSLDVPSAPWDGQWFDVEALSAHLDWFAAMTYLLHGPSWSDHAGPNAPLYASSAGNALHWGGETTVDTARGYYLGRGVPPEKLLIGLPFFGVRFDGAGEMDRPLSHRGGAPLDYREIAPLVGQGWQMKRDEAGYVPYLAGIGGVISFDDPAAIAAKCSYVAANGIGGVIIWHLGKDWRPGEGGAGQPLLEAARGCR